MSGGTTSAPTLKRETFRTSRLLDFCGEKELTAQIGHQRDDWPLVILKELVDNAVDACEEAGIAPAVEVKVDAGRISVRDNGPGLPAKVVEDVLDFSIRVSSREAYVSPTRGAQGNALKTIVAMPFALDGEHGRIEIQSKGVRHTIDFGVGAARRNRRLSSRSLRRTRARMHQGHLDVPEGILDALIMDLAVPAWGRCLAAANPHLRIAQLEEQLREACGQVAAGEHDAKAATALRLLPTYLARGGRL